jgi:hypothetical protein
VFSPARGGCDIPIGRVNGFGTGSSSGLSFSRGVYVMGLVGVSVDGVGLVA